MLSVAMLNVDIMNDVMLNVAIMNDVMLSIVMIILFHINA
jgi:hypothetical protein